MVIITTQRGTSSKYVLVRYENDGIVGRDQDDSRRPCPINEWRNASLRSASELGHLVWFLDIDCVVSAGACETLIGTPERDAALRERCCIFGDAVVVPCLSESQKCAPS